MKLLNVKYQTTNNFSELVLDYLERNKKLEPFINHFPSLENFEKQIIEKNKHEINRSILVEVLKKQNSSLTLSKESKENIDSLLQENTFTVTTGHQLCLFTGPLYFIYKIISTINLAEQLKEKHSDQKFVPIFWMASEDHDFEEINSVNIFEKKINWEREQEGPVGRMSLDGLKSVLEELKKILGDSENAKKIIKLFENAYLNHKTLSEASRYLVNEIFGKYGLVILDGDNKKLKKQFVSVIKKDVVKKGFVTTIKDCTKKLSKSYKTQAYFREINFFRLSNYKRELIKKSLDKIDIENNPEEFSPNVLMRPLYQETILPNIAYIGGAAEIAYWMQLRAVFKKEKIPFPILILRNSVIILNRKQDQNFKELGFKLEDLFLSENILKKKYILSKYRAKLSLDNEKNKLENLYNNIAERMPDIGLKKSVHAQLKKQLNLLCDLEKKLIRYEKKKHENSLNQITRIKKQLFPNNKMQERHDNFSSFYLKDGENFLEIIKSNLDPLSPNFVILAF